MSESLTTAVEQGVGGMQTAPLAALGDILVVFAPLALAAFVASRLGTTSLWGGMLINLAFVASVLIGGVVLKRRGKSWRDLGLRRPPSWARTALGAVGAALGALVLIIVVQFLLASLPSLAPPDISRFNPLAGNLPLFLLMLALAWTTIAFGEEMIYRAFLIDRLAALLGGIRQRQALAVLGSGLIFGLAHYAEGPAGMVTNGAFGLLFALIYVRSGRNLWITILAHGLLNTLRFTLLYLQVL